MAALPNNYSYATTGDWQWDINRPDWGYAYYPDPDNADYCKRLACSLSRQAKASRDRQVIAGIARLQGSRAVAEIQGRRAFLRPAPKRQTEAQRARGR